MQDDFEKYAEEISSGLNITNLFRTLDSFEMQEAEWLVPGLIPKGQITTLASDGGLGKTSAWVALAAAISAGKSCFLDPVGTTRKPGIVLFLSSEDSVKVVLKKRLAAAGADETRIISPDFTNDSSGFLRKLKFGTKELESVISELSPDLCIFDPIQGFVPQGCVMGDRAAMRDCMAPLVALGEKCGTTFLIVCHTNKRSKVSGRDRIADSSDLWDISRSVLMMGWSETEGVRYLSHEKCNYGPLQQTQLFTIDGEGIIHSEGKTWKRDRDFQGAEGKVLAKREDAASWIIHTLEDRAGKMTVKELYSLSDENGISERTMERAKAELSKQGKIRVYGTGYGSDKVYYIQLTYFPEPPKNIF